MGMKKRCRRTHLFADTEKNAQSSHDQVNQECHELSKQLNDAITYKYLYTVIFIACVSMVFYVLNIRSNIRLLYTYYMEGDYWYFSFLLTFIVLSRGITVYESYRFYNQNGNQYIPRDFLPPESLGNWAMKWGFGIVLACSIPRYVDIIKYAWKARQAKKTKNDRDKIYFVAMIWEDAELTKLNQFLCFTQSAAQLLLNLYIMLKDRSNFGDLSISWIFPIISILNLSRALVSYDQNISLMNEIKRDEEDRQNNQSSGIDVNDTTYIAIHYMIKTNWTECTLLFLSNFFWIVSRLIALCLFATGYGWLIWPACCAHLIPTFIWHKKINKLDFLDSIRLSFLHLYAYLYPLANESDKLKHPRLSPALYQSVCLLENIFLMFLWTTSKLVGDGKLHHGITSVLSYPWNEWTFLAPWIVQLATMISSCFLFWWFDKKRQDNHNQRKNIPFPSFPVLGEITQQPNQTA